GRDRGLRQQRAGAELRPLGHEVMLGHEPVLIAEPVGEDPLPHLADEDALVALVDLLQRAVVHHHPVRRGDSLQVGGAVVEDADLDGHDGLPSGRYSAGRLGRLLPPALLCSPGPGRAGERAVPAERQAETDSTATARADSTRAKYA